MIDYWIRVALLLYGVAMIIVAFATFWIGMNDIQRIVEEKYFIKK